jgi:hypothetical protein
MNKEKYRISIDGNWDLRDLYQFPHTYTQVYAVLYVFEEDLTTAQEMRRNHVFSRYPWRGGYSAVNFYNGLYYTMPLQDRPQIVSMQYASPGWIDIGAYVTIAMGIQQMLIAFSKAGRHLNDTYNKIQDGVRKRKLNDIKLRKKEFELEGERLKFIKTSAEEMAKLLGFKKLEEMHKITGNPLITLKMMLSLYRRLRILDEFEEKGKTKIKDEQYLDN